MSDRATVMIIDDDERNCEILKTLLDNGQEDYIIHIITKSTEAMEKLRQAKPDIILLDIMMPEIDGFSICKKIRQDNSFNPFTKIIFLSAKIDVNDQLTGLNLGANDYLPKPYEGEILLAKLRVLVKLKNTEDQLKKSNDDLQEMIELNQSLLAETEAKKNYLSKRMKKLLSRAEGKDLDIEVIKKMMDYMRIVIPNIAGSDIPLLKAVLYIIENSRDYIRRTVLEGREDEDFLRALQDTPEPIETVISNISALINFIVNLKIIDEKEIIQGKIESTNFYMIIDNIMKNGRISPNNFKNIIDFARPKMHVNEYELF